MGKHTDIAWTNHTFNPVWGCARVSAECQMCYAEAFSNRLGQKVWGKTAPRRTFGDKHWAEPLTWNAAAEKKGERARVFCASMADVFEDHPDWPAQRERLWLLVDQTQRLDWLLLTKRPENMNAMTPYVSWPSNMWAGTTIGIQASAPRVDSLREVDAAIRFLSVEPLIGPLQLNLEGIAWVIVGGESGPKRRPMELEWMASVVAQAKVAGCAVFVKQDGGLKPGQQGRIPDDIWALKEVPS